MVVRGKPNFRVEDKDSLSSLVPELSWKSHKGHGPGVKSIHVNQGEQGGHFGVSRGLLPLAMGRSKGCQ